MYSTRTRVHARIPNGHPREEKRACWTKVRGQVGELNGPRAPRQADCRARHGKPRRLTPRAEVGEEVRVGVGVGVGPVEFKLKASIATTGRHLQVNVYTDTMHIHHQYTNSA